MRHTAYILGSGQDAGVPQFGGRAPADLAARRDPARARLGPGLALLDGEGRCLLADVSPDLRAQEARLVGVPGYRGVDAVALTHAHVGHYAGLIHFGREAAHMRGLPCYCTRSMGAFLSRNAPWSQLVELGNLNLRPLVGRVEVWPGLTIEAFPVPHRGEYTDTVALSFNGLLLYVPDIDAWSAWPRARELVAAHRIALLDATFHSAAELPGRDPREIPHPLVPDTLATFADLAPGRRLILTHLNHSNPLCDPDGPEAADVVRSGFEIAHDMMPVELDPS
jgi:pyrroloquinoline quinone biosynthesis protein B